MSWCLCGEGRESVLTTKTPRRKESPRRSGAATKLISLAFLGVLGALAVKVLSRINRQDAKSAKNFAKQNSFQESKDFRLSSTAQPKGCIPNPRHQESQYF